MSAARRVPTSRRGAINEWHRGRKLAVSRERKLAVFEMRDGALMVREELFREHLAEGPATTQELAQALGAPLGATGNALSQLREASVVRRRGKRWHLT